MSFEKHQIKDIWADIKFIPADPNRKTLECTTKKTKFQNLVLKLKEIWKIIKSK